MGKGGYVASELTSCILKNNIRVSEIISNLEKYLNDINDVRTLGFCVTVEHAVFYGRKIQFGRFESRIFNK
jgi:hypothetical protein